MDKADVQQDFRKKESRLLELILQLHGNHKKNKSDVNVHDIIKEEISLPYSLRAISREGIEIFIPKGTIVDQKRILAGANSNIVLRVADSLAEKEKCNPSDWQKVVGTITSSKYIFDIHWYRNVKTIKSIDFKVKGWPVERRK